jgi:predicted transcriptional regulator
VFLKHRGSITRVADKLGITAEAISTFLRGRNNSRRVESAVIWEAHKLLADEAKAKVAYDRLAELAKGTVAA